MEFAWLANSRPDCLFSISQLAQVTDEMFQQNLPLHIRYLNTAFKFAIDNPVSLAILRLDLESLRVLGFSDSSFANNHDLSTQLGHIIFLADGNGTAVAIHFKSYKARRVVRSALGGEIFAFSDMFDIAATLVKELQYIYGKDIPLQLMTDSKSLFDIISKGSRTSEKRLVIDIAAAREAFRDRLIFDIVFVHYSSNIVDGLTKEMSQAALQAVISSAKLDVNPEQWILRH